MAPQKSSYLLLMVCKKAVAFHALGGADLLTNEQADFQAVNCSYTLDVKLSLVLLKQFSWFLHSNRQKYCSKFFGVFFFFSLLLRFIYSTASSKNDQYQSQESTGWNSCNSSNRQVWHIICNASACLRKFCSYYSFCCWWRTDYKWYYIGYWSLMAKWINSSESQIVWLIIFIKFKFYSRSRSCWLCVSDKSIVGRLLKWAGDRSSVGSSVYRNSNLSAEIKRIV